MEQTSRAPEWADSYWVSEDGLKLHYRDYAGSSEQPSILCLHGLTRTCRDYEALAPWLSGQNPSGRANEENRQDGLRHNYRVIVPDLRGHGASEYARDTSSYGFKNHISDINLLLAELEVSQMILIGTSLGGILSALLAKEQSSRVEANKNAKGTQHEPPHIVAAVINDIGPELDRAGLLRISENAQQVRSYPTWMHAARALMESHRQSFPDYDVQRWIALAKRNMVVGQNGRIMLDYDLGVVEPLARMMDSGRAHPDLWPEFEALGAFPTAIIRGKLSDFLSQPTYKAMLKRISGAQGVDVGRAGHTPALDEPVALSAILSLLERAQQG